VIVRRRIPTVAAAVLSLLVIQLAVQPSPTHAATVAPLWQIDMHHNETNFVPGGDAQYWVDVKNIGDVATTGPITVTIQLPAGMTLKHFGDQNTFTKSNYWSCPTAAPGASTLICTRNNGLGPHQGDDTSQKAISIGLDSALLVVVVNVDPSASGDLMASATVSGGGAAEPATALEPTPVGPDPAPFGIVPGTFLADFLESDGVTPVRQAAAHPYQARFSFDFNSVAAPNAEMPERKLPTEGVRDLRLNLPPGFLGDPTAVSECSPSALLAAICPFSSQVGVAHVLLSPATLRYFESYVVPVYNMSHPRGVITDLAFSIIGNPVHIMASLDPANSYAITTTVSNINESLVPYTSDVTIWGVPKDAAHDRERCVNDGGFITVASACSSDGPDKAFLTVPAQCDATASMQLTDMDSWQHPGIFAAEQTYDLPGSFTGCEAPRFEPSVEVDPTGKQANTPTGLNVHIKIPQTENPNGLATPPVRRTVVTLPEGMSFSPSFSEGLQSCSLAQMKLGTNEPIECPDAARIGEVTLHTPLLPKAAEGSMYLATQRDNPFGSLFALYLVLHDTEERGALIKIPGRIDLDPVTGQITTTFDDTPEFPFDDLTLKFRSGPRAPLVNPPSCGIQTIGVKVASWAQPNDPVDASNTYRVSEGPNGTACPSDPAHRPFQPHFSAGTINNSAGSYSPFAFRLDRDDSEQELSQVTTVLPPGLVAKIAGIPPCPETAIASISTAEGTGAAERNSPACPSASQIGTLSAGLGAGQGPSYFPGRVYLAGPYKGAPLSMAIVTPGLAGPFDLGNVVVRVALFVDHSTAQVTAVSDSFPTILQGVILRVRDVRLSIDRPNTTLNPTNCEPMAVAGAATGTGGARGGLSNRFQAGDCAALAFKPKLALRLFGGTKRGAYPKLRATLRMPTGGANIARASVALPHSEFLAQEHIKTICTRVQYAADQCPAASIYGTAVAKTPLFSQPLEGPVYLRSSSNPLPDMVAKLKGPDSQPIEVDLSGRIDSVNAGLRNTFDVVPDAPVESFTLELEGGKKGLLVNSRNLCKSVSRATAKFSGQNGDLSLTHPLLQNSCEKRNRGKKRSSRDRGRSERVAMRLMRSAF
jgi:uncharacterized repeat protein (TIGR01451 family)